MSSNFELSNSRTGNTVDFTFGGEAPTPTSDVSNSTVAFTQASTRANISTGEKLSVICGKIKKFFADLKTVAFTGSYNDLSDTPTIPTVNNATLTITQGGTTKGTFTANASENVTIDLDAGGGGIEYYAGQGLALSENVFYVVNPVSKNNLILSNQAIPCFLNNTLTNELLKQDGTPATLADCTMIGTMSESPSEFAFHGTVSISIVSGAVMHYDYSQQSQTECSVTAESSLGSSYFNSINTIFGYEALEFAVTANYTYNSQDYQQSARVKFIAVPNVMLNNYTLYAFASSDVWSDPSQTDYLENITLTLNTDLIGF